LLQVTGAPRIFGCQRAYRRLGTGPVDPFSLSRG